MTTPEELEQLKAEAAQALRAAEEAQRELEEATREVVEPAVVEVAADAAAPVQRVEAAAAPAGAAAALSPFAQSIAAGYAFEGVALEIGALVENDAPVPGAQVRIPFGMLNRHGLIAGATGTGKTKTLQVLAEQVSAGGVPVFAADIKGDLSGLAVPGTTNEKLAARCVSIGQEWTPSAAPTEFYRLGDRGTGVPIRATVASFGPVLLSKVLGLNPTQESSLSLVFHYAETKNVTLSTLEDLRRVLVYLDGEGRPELKEIGGISAATLGVILRELTAFAAEGADSFFGQPEIAVTDFLRTSPDGRGIVSMLEVPGVQDQPAVFSTFLMYVLQQLFKVLPEVGDTDKPVLVFFFDEAHLLFKDASKEFLSVITQTVRLIRSKGVGIFFVTQTPKDVPADVLAQLGSRVQHQLRAHTPEDAKALKAAVQTYPNTDYDLAEVLTSLGTGEAIVTVMDEDGAPTPVAWTKVRAPQGSMNPMPAESMAATVAASPLQAKYGTPIVSPPIELAPPAAVEAPAPTPKAAPAPKPKAKPTRRGRSSAERVIQNATNQAVRTATRELLNKFFKK
jgi:DNA helicase HerA-like ATPase